MRVIVSDFIRLDGVAQAPGAPGEDTDGAFAHGGWSMPYFDPATMGPAIGDIMAATEALLFGRRTWQAMAAAWPDRGGDPFADRTILLGRGKRLFRADGAARALQLVSATTTAAGVLICTYRPVDR